MSFDLSFMISTEYNVPDPELLKTAVAALPNMIPVEEPRGCEWQIDYLNPDTGVSCEFSWVKPDTQAINFKAWDTGLKAVVPTMCPTFVARECMPIIEKFTRLSSLWVYTPNGEILERCDASQLQMMWVEMNRRTAARMGNSAAGRNAPHYFPQEQLDAMWSYANARNQLTKRYQALNIYVPRSLILRNKLDRRQMYRAMMWADMEPTVYPDVDAFVISRPNKLIFNRFPSGDSELFVVRRESIEDILKPNVREATRPFPHRLIENTSSIRLPIFRKLFDTLQLRFRNFETVNVEEVIDIKL